MNTLAQSYSRTRSRSGQRANLVRVRSRRINKAPRVNRESPARHLLFYYCCCQSPTCILLKGDNACMVQRFAAHLRKSFNQGDVVASIVKLTVGVHHRSEQVFRSNLRHTAKGFFSRDESTCSETVASRNPVVQLQPHGKICDVHAVKTRNEERPGIR